MAALSEIEQQIGELKKRYAELDDKLVPLRNGVIDGSISAAMGVVTKEIQRLESLRQDALVADLVEKEPAAETKPAVRPPAPPVVGLAFDFPDDGVPKSDPLEGLDCLPQGEDEFAQLQQKTASFCIEQAGELIREVRAVDKAVGARPVVYTQGQHLGVQAAIGFSLAQTRLLVAKGREKRDALERKLVARIEALESRLAEVGGAELEQLRLDTRSNHAVAENMMRRIGALEASPKLSYKGVWASDLQYNAGDIVTEGGSMFHANAKSRGVKPGGGSEVWTLAVKRGKDGKDARGLS